MAFNTFKCNYLTPLHFKGLIEDGGNVSTFPVGGYRPVFLVNYGDVLKYSLIDSGIAISLAVHNSTIG